MFQFLNLDNASKAEKEILHTILFKDGHHQRKEFFKDLRPEYEASLDVGADNDLQCGALFGGRPHSGTPRHDVDNSDTSSAADFPVEGEAGMQNDIASHSMRPHGEQQMRSYYTSAPLPQPHAGGAHQQLGHHPQLSMYHPQMMQNPPGQYLPQFPVIPVPYGAPAPHNIGLPAHLPPQPYMPAEVSDMHMHQKIHDMHHSPGGGAPHSSKYRPNKNDRRPRRAEEAYHPHHQPQFYPNMSYGPPMYYTTQSVTNMTGTPLIMPGSGAPTPIYHQGHYPPQMYPPMLGNEPHIQQQHQPGPGGSNVHQRTERIDSPKTDMNMFAGANGDSVGLSSSENEQHHHNRERERPENEGAGTSGRSSRNSQHQFQPQPPAELKIDTKPPGLEEPRSALASSSEKSPKPQPKEENETSTSASVPGPVPMPVAAPQPENRWGEALNGNLTDSLPSSARVQQMDRPQPQPEQLPETNLVQETVNVPSKPEPQPQGPKTWSSTVNGGNSQSQTAVPSAAAAAMAPAAQMPHTRTKSKDSGEFPDLSNATVAAAAGPTAVAAPTPSTSKSAMATAPAAPARTPTPSASQSKMSWASVASRQTAGGGPPNGTSSTISLGPGHEHATAKKLTGESAGLGAGPSESGMSKLSLDNDSSVGLYSYTQEPVYDNDPVALKLGEFLSTYVLDHHTFSLTPRGLSNQNNFCYINATLQALVACPPFVNLFRSLYDIIGKKPCKSTPIIQSMFDFIMEFEPITRLTQQRNRKTSDAFYVGANFEASGIRKVLGLLDGATFKVEGRQQDAEEFLSHLLNALHDEMIKVIKWSETQKEKSAQSKSGQSSSGGPREAMTQPPPTATDEDDDEQWQVMGPKNKGCMTRKTSLSKSPISEMFVGQMCSALNRANSLKSTTLQPFFTLQLDIQSENIHSIRDALEGISVKEEVTGCVASNGVETEAWKQMSLEVLPSILILHMKRFVFDTAVNTIRKLDKRVDFSIDLEIAKDLLSVNSKNKYTSKQRLYKLFAVVYHDGEEAIKGHYIADTFHPSGGSLWGQFGWIRYDDTAVKGVGENQILNPQSPRVPYLLYYRRVDTLQTKKDARP